MTRVFSLFRSRLGLRSGAGPSFGPIGCTSRQLAKVEASLIPEQQAVAPGATVTVALERGDPEELALPIGSIPAILARRPR